MRKKYWPKVDTGIWRTDQDGAYWVEVRKDNSRLRACKTVIGTIHDARRVRNRLWETLETRSLKSQGKLTNIWSALVYYVLKKYWRSAQYRIGSGPVIMRFWMLRIGDKSPKDLSYADINQAIHVLQSKGYTNAGIVPYVSRFKTALRFCKSEGVIDLNADSFDDVEKVKVKKPLKLAVADNDIDRIFSAIPEWGRPVIVYKRLVPSRVLELYDARAEFIDLDKKCFLLVDNKNDEPREMPIPDVMLDYFSYAKESGSEWVFFREEQMEDGKMVFHKLSRNHLTKLFSNARDALEIDKRVVLRLLRHGTIRKWLRAFDEGLVGGVAGASPETLHKHYDLVEIGSKVDAANQIAANFKLPDNALSFRKAVEG